MSQLRGSISAMVNRNDFRRLAVACALLIAIASSAARAQTYQHLYDFGSLSKQGVEPDDDRLTQGEDGNLYGTTGLGGAHGAGTIFMVTPTGTYTDLVAFNGKNGFQPNAGLMRASDGNFYGVSFLGGKLGFGTLFRFTPPNTLKVLHSFSDGDGASPEGTPVQAADGNLYGATDLGKTYRLTLPGGKFQQLSGVTPGRAYGRLLLGSDKNLYGASYNGGDYGAGTVFQMTTSGAITTIYSFTGGTDGSGPGSDLIEGYDGYLYGTTTTGGTNGNGEVFQISLSGTLNVVHSFDTLVDGLNNDGAIPSAGLLQPTNGSLYGPTFNGGAYGSGTIFQTTTGGSFMKLFDFSGKGGAVPGEVALTGLVEHTNGELYGLTELGGANGEGTFYSVTPPSPVLTLTVEGPIFVLPGVPVEILGNDLEQTFSLSFAGVPAQFELGSDTYLTAQVPTQAVDGFVMVTLETGLQIQSQSVLRILPMINNLNPGSGRVGTQVQIAGGGFAGATSVTFGGVNTGNFAVISPALIEATVPAGARTGKVTVTTPNGTAISKLKFVVRP